MQDDSGYWPSLIKQVRLALNMSQENFAEAVFSNQATVSRWEKGIVVPTYDKQLKIEKLASEANITSLGGLIEVVRCSPFRMLLVDRREFIIAASKSSEWEDNKFVKNQLSSVASKDYARFSRSLDEGGFWKKAAGQRIDVVFNDGERLWRSVVISVVLRTEIYAVVQQEIIPSNTSKKGIAIVEL